MAQLVTASDDGIPIVDLTAFMADPSSEAAKVEIAKVAHALHAYGCLVIKDPRVDETHNDRFVDMLERYFAQSDGVADARPDLSYQVQQIRIIPDSSLTQTLGRCDTRGYRSSSKSLREGIWH